MGQWHVNWDKNQTEEKGTVGLFSSVKFMLSCFSSHCLLYLIRSLVCLWVNYTGTVPTTRLDRCQGGRICTHTSFHQSKQHFIHHFHFHHVIQFLVWCLLFNCVNEAHHPTPQCTGFTTGSTERARVGAQRQQAVIHGCFSAVR